MQNFSSVLDAVLPVFTLIGAGLILRRLQWLTATADASLLRLTVNLLIPCLIFDSLLGNGAVRQLGNVLLPPLAGFCTVALGMGLGALAARLVPEDQGTTRRTFAFTVGVYNYGYIPLPLAQSLFDRETVAVLLVHNLGVEVALWTLGALLLSVGRSATWWQRLSTPPVLAIPLTLTLNALGASWVPDFLNRSAHMLGQCAIPMGMVLIGATIADHWGELATARGGRVMGLAVVLRLGVLPAVFLLAAGLLPMSPELKRVVLLQAAMPAAVFPVVMARHYGGDPATALRVVVATTACSLMTMPAWIQLGLRWVQR